MIWQLERAQTAHTHTLALGPRCRDEKEKAAWNDCLELYQHTVDRLNRTTTDPYKSITREDAQTWLSTAITNVETCQTGFVELGVTDNILPLMSNNVSGLVSNILALNDVPYGTPSTAASGFPTWVKPGDRKLLQSSSPASSENVVVAQDGSGDYKTISAAVSAAGSKSSGTRRYVIYIKAGTYNENVVVGSKLKNIMFVGDGIGKTIITRNSSVGGGSTTFNSATVAVTGDGFMAKDMTFRNTAGAANHQAVALRSGSDLSVFYRCSFQGYQDTLYVYSNRQFYRSATSTGPSISSSGAGPVFQSCNIYARNPPNKVNTITAQGRTDPNQNTRISIHNCRVTAASDLQSSAKTYLGRPWKAYSRTVFMKTYLDSLIDSAGWLPWSGNFALDTLYYGEYMNTGPGSSTASRVSWAGFHIITSATEASKFNVGSFIVGASWFPATGVPYTSGL
ncbi:hypothetical protein SAY86_020248 [Trapa natans]|uniref:Pectinesterase n=1 Tax=Trapa natans TaxID=22666 RepID=A0AAN7R1L7_TRANT|nr:hypothetical protein SAY86_020248 [Trapa natans]